MASSPAVSVIIPTYQRPDLVVRAVRSVLDQTLTDLEVIVVVDGRDAASCAALRTITDTRLSVHVPERHLGNGEARNVGVALARAPWVSFLDDDDTWLPDKLARQLPLAQRSAYAQPIVSCRVLVRTEVGTMIWPRRLPFSGENWSEYFFCRTTPFTGEGMVTMTSILTSRELLIEVPFASGLARHVDPDWMLRAVQLPGVGVEFVSQPEPLVVWYAEHGRPRITTQPDWVASFDWCQRNRQLFSPRGYAAFVLHVVGSNAAAQHHWRAFPLLLREASANGHPAMVDLASHCANFLLPEAFKRQVAVWYARLVSQR